MKRKSSIEIKTNGKHFHKDDDEENNDDLVESDQENGVLVTTSMILTVNYKKHLRIT